MPKLVVLLILAGSKVALLLAEEFYDAAIEAAFLLAYSELLLRSISARSRKLTD